jgi:hypothetical protein
VKTRKELTETLRLDLFYSVNYDVVIIKGSGVDSLVINGVFFGSLETKV